MSLLSKTIKTFSAAVLAVTLAYSATTTAAPTPGTVYSSGELIGLTNLNVAGYGLYDVTFNSQFQGNFYGTDFVFQAGYAGIALLEDGGLFDGLDFDLNPEKTRGCGSALGYCDWFVAAFDIGQGFIAGGILENLGGLNDSLDSLVLSGSIIPALEIDGLTYLDWTPSKVSEVPVPAALFMFGPALLGFLGLRRKRNA